MQQNQAKGGAMGRGSAHMQISESPSLQRGCLAVLTPSPADCRLLEHAAAAAAGGWPEAANATVKVNAVWSLVVHLITLATLSKCLYRSYTADHTPHRGTWTHLQKPLLAPHAVSKDLQLYSKPV